MTSPYVAEIRPFGFNFAPRGWALCNGQIISIAQNTALFSLLGTTYGGNGQTTFALPDLRGRTPLGPGQGPGLSPYVLGEVSGEETVTLLSTEMPAHSHGLTTRNIPTNASQYTSAPAVGSFISRFLYHATSSAEAWAPAPLANAASLHPTVLGLTGGGQPHNNLQPLLTVSFCIAMQGVFPSRN